MLKGLTPGKLVFDVCVCMFCLMFVYVCFVCVCV